jgi:hypothetical protein
MKRIGEALAIVVITAVMTFVFQLVGAYLTTNKGEILVGSLTPYKEGNVLPIKITNISNKRLNDIHFAVPAAIRPEEIMTSFPIKIEAMADNLSRMKRLIVSEVEEKSSIDLLLPVPPQVDVDSIEVLNAREKHIDVKYMGQEEPETVLRKSVREALLFTGLTIIIIVLVVSINTLMLRRTEIDNNKRIEEVAKLQHQLTEIRENIQKTRVAHHRLRLFLGARVSDLQKELDFWRDTIRKLLYNSGKKGDAEKVIEAVTDNLKTYRTRERSYTDYKTLMELLDASQKREKEG